MAQDAITEEDGGIRIKYYPDRVIVSAFSIAGLNGLKVFTSFGKDAKGIRARYKISEMDYPNSNIKKMLDGSIYMVEFWR